MEEDKEKRDETKEDVGENLEETLKKYMEEAEEYKNKWLYTYAEFENYRKRVKAEIEDVVFNTMSSFLKDFLNVIDLLESAISCASGEIAEGLKLIHKSAVSTLEKNGVVEIDIKPGDDFDWQVCEAISTEEGEEENKVIKVLRKGYKFRDKVLRPVLVVVSKREEKEDKVIQ